MTQVVLPTLAEGIDKASVSYWHFREGDAVKEGQELVELVTDKATFTMPSPATGILKKLMVEEGNEVRVGELLAEIE